MSTPGHRHSAHGSTPLRVMLALASAAAGAALVLAPLSPQRIAVVTGLGLVCVGMVMLGSRVRSRLWVADRESVTGSRLRGLAGTAIIVCGTLVAVLPMLGATWVAFAVGTALVLHGAASVFSGWGTRGLWSVAGHRVASILAGTASVVFGAVALAWPVLTLTVFRLGVGAWLVFLGLHALVELVCEHAHSRAHVHEHRHGHRHAAALRGAATRGSSHESSRGRSRLRIAGAALALVTAVAFAAGSALVLRGTPLPEPGPFYAAPSVVPNEAGRLIRAEPLTTGVPKGAEAWKMLYTTTHPDGSPAVSSGTVLTPSQREADPLPLITVAHGTTGVVAKCAPSLSATPFADGAGAALEEMVTAHGWAAVISDYIGLGTGGTHPYLVGDAEARNALDAALAARELGGVTFDTRTIIWGHSQGGQGALWAGQIAAEYAPQLTVEGVAAFAPAADLFGLAEADKTEAAGKTVSAYIASTWDRLYPELELSQHLTPGSRGEVERIHDLCFNGDDVLAAILRGSQAPNQIFPDSLLAGPFGDQLKAQTPLGPFPAPVLVAQGLADPLVKPALQHDWVAARCAAGEHIDYRTYPGLSHNSLVAADSPLTPQLVQWTLDRWNGEAPTPSCRRPPSSTAD